MPPLLVPGGESAVGWLKALNSLKPNLSKRIKALICDGDPHLVHQARLKGWLIQRCHFHLLASIKNYVTAGPLSRNQTFGKLVLRTVQKTISNLKTPDVNELWSLVRLAKNPKLRGRLRGLIKNLDDFRTYLRYPELNLPTTSNSAESLVQVVRDLQYRTKGFRTKKSFLRWLNAVCLNKKSMTCNGKNQPIKHG
ncbi:MAG: transposase [bacterium]|nr:transposase [bacterium]